MAITLTEGEKYSTTTLQKVVTDLLAKESRITEILPFETILGNSLTYNVVTSRSGASLYDVGDTWDESTPTVTQHTATLKIIGGDADIDKFLLKTRSNQMDLKGQVVNDKIRAVNEKFMDTFFYGTTATAKNFNGLQVLLASTAYNTVHASTAANSTGAALSMARLRQANDLVTGYKNAKRVVVMTKTVRTRISVFLDSIGSAFPRGVNEYGKNIALWDDMEIVTDDNLLDTETISSDAYSSKTAGHTSTIFILTMQAQACCGIHSGDMIQVEDLGTLETKDAQRIRVKWYVSLKLEDIRSCAKVDGILTTSAAAA